MKQEQAAEAAPVRFENPLMPDERLRQMYTAMVQMRMLEEHLLARKAADRRSAHGRRIDTVRGEEAARASTALSLGAGDMISDRSAAPAMDLLLGANLGMLKRDVRARGKVDRKPALGEGSALRLVLAGDAGERLRMCVGAAAALKAQRAGRVLLVYMGAGEVRKRDWKETLTIAGKEELPVIFVVLPEAHASVDAGRLCARSPGWGVPGFPVDGVDAIGLYRVMQESLLRGRSSDGPALIECIPFHLAGDSRQRVEDPVERLGELLLAKGVASSEWMRRTRSAFSMRLGRVSR